MSTLVIERPRRQKLSTIEYPTSDGKPMAETGIHVLAIMQLIAALRYFLRNQDVYVIGNIFLYYEEGNPKAHKAPDTMVIRNVGKHERRSFKVWEEKAVPSVIFEITSKKTKNEDTENKHSLYESLGIREYFLFDPLHEYLEQQFIGYRLLNGKYVLIPANEDGDIFSTELEAVLRPDGQYLRIVDPETGRPVPTPIEAIDMAEQEARRAEQEAQRAEQETRRAEQEAQRAEQEAQRANQAAQRADAVEIENRRLRAEIEELRKRQAPSSV